MTLLAGCGTGVLAAERELSFARLFAAAELAPVEAGTPHANPAAFEAAGLSCFESLLFAVDDFFCRDRSVVMSDTLFGSGLACRGCVLGTGSVGGGESVDDELLAAGADSGTFFLVGRMP